MRPYRGAHRAIGTLAIDKSVVIAKPPELTAEQHRRSVSNAVSHCVRTRGFRLKMKSNRVTGDVRVTRVLPLDEVMQKLGY